MVGVCAIHDRFRARVNFQTSRSHRSPRHTTAPARTHVLLVCGPGPGLSQKMSFPPHDCKYRSCASSQYYSSHYRTVTAPFNFAKEEEKVLAYWREIDAFQTSLKLSEGRPEFSFYDGPPFATGLPHYGHLLAGTIKVSSHTTLSHRSCFLHAETPFCDPWMVLESLITPLSH